MSAPLVVNTKDGVCWTRRTVTSGGIALYAPEKVKTCPEFVLATLPELAEHGIVGSADALPMPVGPERSPLAEQLGDAKPAADSLVASLAKSVRDVREHEHPTWEDLYCLNLTSYMGERMGPVLRRLLDAEAHVAELEARLAEYARPADEDPIAYALTDAAEEPFPPYGGHDPRCAYVSGMTTRCTCSGPAEDDVTPQVTKLRALLAGQREQTQAGDR